jgi:hypothetical protein
MQKLKNIIFIQVLLVGSTLFGMGSEETKNSKTQDNQGLFSKDTLKKGARLAFNWGPLLYSFGKPFLEKFVQNFKTAHKDDKLFSDYTVGLTFEELREKQVFDQETLDGLWDCMARVQVDPLHIRFIN